MLNRIVFSIVISILFFSCTEVIFETPQPPGGKNLKEIPEALLGSYSFVVLSEQEIIHITKDYIDGEEGKKYLSDSLIFRKMGNVYVVNQLINEEGESKGKWSVYIFEEKGCGFLKATTFIISEEEYAAEFFDSNNAIKVGEGEEKQFIINPKSKKDFEKIMKQKEATLSIILEKIDN